MSTRRSYLETLNEGRQRRPDATLEQLNRSLEALEEQFRPAPLPGREAMAAPPRPRREHRDAPRSVQRDESEAAGGESPPRAGTLAEEVEQARLREENATAAARIAGELRGLRTELMLQERRQLDLGQTFERELGELRHELDRLGSGILGRDFERLADALGALAESSGPDAIAALRTEIGAVRAQIDGLGRDAGGADQHWEALDRRIEGFEQRLGDGKGMERLQTRLDALDDAVRHLPDGQALGAVEDRVRALAEAMDHLARQRDGTHAAELATMGERLDEISRAVVASAVAAKPVMHDPEPFDRLEARIAAVSRQVEQGSGSDEEIMNRLMGLQARVDTMAERASLPEQAVAQLSQQVAIIAARLDEAPNLPDPDFLFAGIEQRFETLAATLETRQGEASERAAAVFRDLERRLDEVADRVDEAGVQRDQALIGVIDARLEEFARRIETKAPAASGGESRLIRSLEAQIAVLTEHLAHPGANRGDIELLAPRLQGIERSIEGNRDAVIEAAREAAEHAVRSIGTGGADAETVAGLAQDLKSLEALTRRSDERNARTFEAIHDTLIKIVDRLGAVDRAPAAVTETATAQRQSIADAPPLEAAMAPAAEPSLATDMSAVSAAQAAQAAAVAALDEEPAPTLGRVRSMFGGLGRKRSARKEAEAPAPAAATPDVEPVVAEAPALDLDEPLDPKLLNRPIEPNTGGPDLSAIMRRVRDERVASGAGRSGQADVAKSDFIAAARRAAQAAAAEAEVLKRGGEGEPTAAKSRLGGVLSRHRKPILMAVGAVMIALAGLQLGGAMLADAGGNSDAPASAGAAVPSPLIKKATAAARDSTLPIPAAAQKAAPAITPAAAVAQPAPKPVAVPAPAPKVVPVSSPTAEMPVLSPASTATKFQTASAPVLPPPPVAMPVVVASAPAVAAKPALPEVPDLVQPQALREAAAAGDAKALFELGARYAEGRGVATDMAAAARWLEASAGLGFAPAQYRMGSLYEKGAGVGRDLAKARDFYTQAAEAGNAAAMHNLAVLHAMGADGVTNNEQAARWFARAAELGVKDSQFNLGILSAKGVGMERNLEESYKWFALVARAGDPDAAAKRDEIAGSLPPEQLERARAAAELWKAKPADPEANAVELPESWQSAAAAPAALDKTAAVKTIQLILAKNGYDVGSPDGLMGGKTTAAIKAFQKDNALEPTGEVDQALVKALLARK